MAGIKELLAKVAAGGRLSEGEAEEAFEAIMSGQATAAQTGALLGMLQVRGVGVEELVGAARVMRRKMVPVPVPEGMRVIDTCGTGGTHSRLFNVSTTAGLVAAAAGYRRGMGVAKHGNRSVTSACGSSQVLEALGVKLEVGPEIQRRCLEAVGFCFCYAPMHHPAMKFAGPVRAELGFRTIFNLLGPLTNPAGARRQVMGVCEAKWTEPIARVLGELGSEAVMVVYGWLGPEKGAKGVGEISIFGPTQISRLEGGQVQSLEWDAGSLGLRERPERAEELVVNSPQESAAMVMRVLEGQPGPAREMVVVNAAAALMVGGVAGSWEEGLERAREAIDSGAARRVLEEVRRITQEGG